ncbi:MAG: nuclear transport factor 2 family protein [Vulcanimicrobiaceae bacterium]
MTRSNKGKSTPLELPKPVATYFGAVSAKDTDTLALCFTDDALVHDEGRDYRGIDAIKSWNLETYAKYQYVVEPLNASLNGNTVVVRARLTGNFPGNTVDLDFAFTLANDKIRSLLIQ